MSEFSFPFTGGSGGDDGPYSASFFAGMIEGLFRQNPTTRANASVLVGSGNGTDDALAVTETSPASNSVEIKQGKALVQGYYYYNDSDATLTVSANNDGSGFDRIDTVVLGIDFISQTVRVSIVEGTPSGSPVPPTLTKTASLYQVPLADIQVANLFTTIVNADIDNTVRQQGIIWETKQGGTGLEGGYVAGNLLVSDAVDSLTPLSPPTAYDLLGYDGDANELMAWQDARVALIYSTSSTALGVSWGALTLSNFTDPAGIVTSLSTNNLVLTEGYYKLLWCETPYRLTSASPAINFMFRLYNTTGASLISESMNHYMSGSTTIVPVSTLPPTVFYHNGTDNLQLQGIRDGGNVVNAGYSTTSLGTNNYLYAFALQKIGN